MPSEHDKIDSQKVIGSLNTILELELAGVVRYLHYSLMVFGHARIPIIGWMRNQATEGMNHAAMAGEHVTSLGGHPSLTIGKLVESHRRHAGRERTRKAAFEVDIAVEVRFQQADMTVERDAAIGARLAEHHLELRRRGCGLPLRAVGVAHRERRPGAGRDAAEHFVDGGPQGSRFYRPMEAEPQLC